MRNALKNSLVLLLTLVIVIANLSETKAADVTLDKEKYLRTLTPNQTVEFLVGRGLIYPSENPNPYAWAAFSKSIVTFVLDYPSEPITFVNHITSLNLANEIRIVVLEFCKK